MMRIQSACLEQTIFFETKEDLQGYKARMDKRRVPYAIVSQEDKGEGCLVRLKKRYTHYPIGEYLGNR